MPKLFWDTDEGNYESDSSYSGSVNAGPEAKADVSPELYAGRKLLPMAGYIGVTASADGLPEKYKKQLANHTPSLHTRSYEQSVADLFSAVIDAMTSLHLPVESVDSPNGVITSDWVRKGESDLNMPSMVGYTRHRFVVRLYRAGVESGDMTKLEAHVIGQLYENSEWVDKKLVRNVSEELFVSIEEQLADMQPSIRDDPR